jgi:hypothetical protein
MTDNTRYLLLLSASKALPEGPALPYLPDDNSVEHDEGEIGHQFHHNQLAPECVVPLIDGVGPEGGLLHLGLVREGKDVRLKFKEL